MDDEAVGKRVADAPELAERRRRFMREQTMQQWRMSQTVPGILGLVLLVALL